MCSAISAGRRRRTRARARGDPREARRAPPPDLEVVDVDDRTLGGEPGGERAADPPPRSGDERDLALEPSGDLVVPPRARRPRRSGRTSQGRRAPHAELGGVHPSRRCASSCLSSSTSIVRSSTSIEITSPSRTNAIVPPRTASGATWPTFTPRVAPLKRPSVTSTTEFPRPRPTIAEVIESISGMPGARPALRSARRRLRRAGRPRREWALGTPLRSRSARRSAMGRALVSCELHDRALGREVSAEDAERPAQLERRSLPSRPPRRPAPVPKPCSASVRPQRSVRLMQVRQQLLDHRRVPPALCRSPATKRPPGVRLVTTGVDADSDRSLRARARRRPRWRSPASAARRWWIRPFR